MDRKMDAALRELFQCAGCALLSSQFMEKELACLLLIPRMTKLGGFPSEDEIRKTMDRVDRMTFGQLIRQLKEMSDVGELSVKLQDALEKGQYRGRINHLNLYNARRYFPLFAFLINMFVSLIRPLYCHEYNKIMDCAHDDSHIDKEEKALLSQFQQMLSNGTIKRIKG